MYLAVDHHLESHCGGEVDKSCIDPRALGSAPQSDEQDVADDLAHQTGVHCRRHRRPHGVQEAQGHGLQTRLRLQVLHQPRHQGIQVVGSHVDRECAALDAVSEHDVVEDVGRRLQRVAQQLEDIAEAGRRLGVQLLFEDREPHGRGVERTAKLVVDASHCIVGRFRDGAVFHFLRGAAVMALGALAQVNPELFDMRLKLTGGIPRRVSAMGGGVNCVLVYVEESHLAVTTKSPGRGAATTVHSALLPWGPPSWLCETRLPQPGAPTAMNTIARACSCGGRRARKPVLSPSTVLKAGLDASSRPWRSTRQKGVGRHSRRSMPLRSGAAPSGEDGGDGV